MPEVSKPALAHYGSRAMTDDLITDQEIAILCSILDGRTANLNADKRKVLDRLIANGFVELSDRAASTCKLTVKAQKLLDDRGVGVSGG